MTLNIAHRGARSLAPENTIAAARKAMALGADLWETDTAVTRDGKIVLFHDTRLDRTTDAAAVFPEKPSLDLVDYSWGELQKLDLGATFIKNDPFGEIRRGSIPREDLDRLVGEKLPSLEQALVFTRDSNWKINIELKELPDKIAGFPLPEKVLDIIRTVGMPISRVIISSFYHPWLEQVQAMEPEMEIQALIGDSESAPLDWGDYRFRVYNARVSRIDEHQIALAKNLGKKINLWTVNDPHDMVRFIRAGVDGIITDYPQRLAALPDRG
ncbi:MAG: glycerophosphodiester phosphodiesterase family protein [Pseudomonadota bacterium]